MSQYIVVIDSKIPYILSFSLHNMIDIILKKLSINGVLEIKLDFF